MSFTADAGPEAMLSVSVLYALPAEQAIVELEFEPGMTAAMAVDRSGLLERFPEIRGHELVLGVFGRELPPDSRLKPGDRVEISRPLLADPRTMRRDFLTEGRVMGGAEPGANRRQEAGSSVRSRSILETRPSSKKTTSQRSSMSGERPRR